MWTSFCSKHLLIMWNKYEYVQFAKFCCLFCCQECRNCLFLYLDIFYILYTNCVWIFTRFMVLFYTFYLNFYISFYLTMGLHSLNAIFHQITRVLYFYLCQYYVTCIMFLNSLQFENELKKVGTFVHLTFVFVCELSNFFGITFHISIFSFVLLFYVFVLWRILSMPFKQVLALLWQMFKKKPEDFFKQSKGDLFQK